MSLLNNIMIRKSKRNNDMNHERKGLTQKVNVQANQCDRDAVNHFTVFLFDDP